VRERILYTTYLGVLGGGCPCWDLERTKTYIYIYMRAYIQENIYVREHILYITYLEVLGGGCPCCDLAAPHALSSAALVCST
jgi:hypothetical protein